MRVAPLAAGLMAVALLSGCGDDDGETTAPSSSDQEVTVTTPSSKPPAPSTLPGTTPSTQTPSTSAAPAPDTTSPGTTTPTSSTTSSSGPLPDSVQARVDAAIADFASRQGVDAAAISVVDAREVTWPDSSLGCPEPGMSYLQVLTSGFLLVLEVNGVQVEYHGGTSGDLFLCEHPRPPVQGVGST